MQQSEDLSWRSCCRRHAARYEAEFLEDIDALGCRAPDLAVHGGRRRHDAGYKAELLEDMGALGRRQPDEAVHVGRRRHAARYEAEFLEDMDALGCRAPTALTRVSEYMGEIRAYVDAIAAKGFAYASAGSVYFSTRAFRCAWPCGWC